MFLSRFKEKADFHHWTACKFIEVYVHVTETTLVIGLSSKSNNAKITFYFFRDVRENSFTYILKGTFAGLDKLKYM